MGSEDKGALLVTEMSQLQIGITLVASYQAYIPLPCFDTVFTNTLLAKALLAKTLLAKTLFAKALKQGLHSLVYITALITGGLVFEKRWFTDASVLQAGDKRYR